MLFCYLAVLKKMKAPLIDDITETLIKEKIKFIMKKLLKIWKKLNVA